MGKGVQSRCWNPNTSLEAHVDTSLDALAAELYVTIDDLLSRIPSRACPGRREGSPRR